MQIYHKPRKFAWVDVETTGLGPDDVVIEVAIIVTDERLEVLERFESLVKPVDVAKFVTLNILGGGEWLPPARQAFETHGIHADAVMKAPPANQVVASIIEMFDPKEEHAPIMVSDNPVFDHRMLRHLFERSGKLSRWPFHYNSWSPIMLTCALGVGRPDKPHRAMFDVEAMLGGVKEALTMLKSWSIEVEDPPEVVKFEIEEATGAEVGLGPAEVVKMPVRKRAKKRAAEED